MAAAPDALFAAFQEWKRAGTTHFALDEKIEELNEDCRAFNQERLDTIRD